MSNNICVFVGEEEICYCKDCTRKKRVEDLDGPPNWCILWNEMMSDFDYCSKGKKEN